MSGRSKTLLEARLHGRTVLVLETALGALAAPEQIEQDRDAWALTGAWRPGEAIDGAAVERWLRGLRPQGGARSAQAARARTAMAELDIARAAPTEGDIVWATPHMEYAGAVAFRSRFADGRTLDRAPPIAVALSDDRLAALLDQVIDEMRRGAVDPRHGDVKPVSPSGALAKFAVHRSPRDGRWHLPGPGRLSTHIVKHEDRADIPAEAAIESVCQRALRRLGIGAARTRAAMIAGRQVIVSERSDRRIDTATGAVTPIHQEEWGAACGRDPDELTQRQGTGGGWTDLYRFLTERSPAPEQAQRDLWEAMAAIALFGHRDIHRRNLGVRYPDPSSPWAAELAPLYDVASMDGQGTQPWRSLGLPIGDEAEIEKVGERAWVRAAEACRADPGEVLAIVAETARRMPHAIEAAEREALEQDEWRDAGAAERRIAALKTGIDKRCERARRPTQHPRRPVPLPEWTDAVIEAMEAGRTIELHQNNRGAGLVVIVHDEGGERRRAGTTQSTGALCRTLERAGAISADEVPELERALERQRHRTPGDQSE